MENISVRYVVIDIARASQSPFVEISSITGDYGRKNAREILYLIRDMGKDNANHRANNASRSLPVGAINLSSTARSAISNITVELIIPRRVLNRAFVLQQLYDDFIYTDARSPFARRYRILVSFIYMRRSFGRVQSKIGIKSSRSRDIELRSLSLSGL